MTPDMLFSSSTLVTARSRGALLAVLSKRSLLDMAGHVAVVGSSSIFCIHDGARDSHGNASTRVLAGYEHE